MTRRWWLAAAMVAGTASAQPAADPPPKPPAARACISPDVPLGLEVDRGQVLSCPYASGDPCTAYRPNDKPTTVRNPNRKPWPAQVSESGDKKLSACSDADHCKPLGKKLTAAIHAQQANDPGSVLVFPATAHLDVVIVAGVAWSVPKDRALALQPPAGKVHPKLTRLDAVGEIIVATWSSCELGCARSELVDAKGATRGATFAAGVAAALGDDRIAIITTETRPVLTIVATATGKVLATLVLGSDPLDQLEVVAPGDHALAAAARVDDAHQLMWIDAPTDHPPSIAATTMIPSCK